MAELKEQEIFNELRIPHNIIEQQKYLNQSNFRNIGYYSPQTSSITKNNFEILNQIYFKVNYLKEQKETKDLVVRMINSHKKSKIDNANNNRNQNIGKNNY
ncbi:unnamed protein product [Paramecium sonneborni]|uniref:Uncharacterized protein n=1 Tax=Paramecium sonneborni TaxID=65129 RepID=A0A8S1KBA2_9CILI|nr:unnamed protein product [Paramecium sonneborni]